MAGSDRVYSPQYDHLSEDQRYYENTYGSANGYAPSPVPQRRRSEVGSYDQDSFHERDLVRPRDDYRRRSYYDEDSDSGFSSEEERRERRHRSKNHGHKASSTRSKSTHRKLDKAKEQISTSDRGVGAGMVGALAGAVIAQETAQRNGKGSIGATIAGLVIGGLAGNVVEKKYSKRQENEKAMIEKCANKRRENSRVT